MRLRPLMASPTLRLAKAGGTKCTTTFPPGSQQAERAPLPVTHCGVMSQQGTDAVRYAEDQVKEVLERLRNLMCAPGRQTHHRLRPAHRTLQ